MCLYAYILPFDCLYHFNNINIYQCFNVSDLGVTICSDLKFSLHCNKIAIKAARRASLILRCFVSNDIKLLVKAFIVYVRPLLEYCTPVWCPYLQKDVDIIESVQRNFTRRLFARCELPYVCYDERIKILVLEKLELRRIIYDMTLYFKIVNKFCDTSLFNKICFCNYTYGTHGHKFKFYVQYARTNVFKYFFLNRYVNVWNILPLNCMKTNVTKCFKQSCILLICLNI